MASADIMMDGIKQLANYATGFMMRTSDHDVHAGHIVHDNHFHIGVGQHGDQV